MIICHVSDLHGRLPELRGDFDIVVCSGDFIPNHKYGPNKTHNLRQIEIRFQTNWILYKVNEIKTWLKGKPLLWCSGNHDFINPCEMFQQHGIEAIDLDNKVIEYKNHIFYGFPYIPFIRNDWAWEKEPTALKQEIQNFLQRLKEAGKFNELDVLVAHCPPYGILDEDLGNHYGNRFMLNALSYQLRQLPKCYLTGHIHKSNGIDNLDEMIVSNAAVVPRIISI